MFERILGALVSLLCAAPFYALAMGRDDPRNPIPFWSGDDTLRDKLGDIPAYNREMAALYTRFAGALLADALNTLLKGDSNVGVEHHVGDDASKLLRELMEKFCASILAAALLISGALIESGTGWTGGFSWCGFVCFALAIALLCWAFTGHNVRRRK